MPLDMKNYLPHSLHLKPNMKSVIQDNLSKYSGEKLTLFSDASAHLKNDAAFGAYQLHATRDKKRSVSQLLEEQALSHS